MIIDKVIYTNISNKKETKKLVTKNAKKKRFGCEFFEPSNRVKNMKNSQVYEQLYAILSAKKAGASSVLIVNGRTIFDFAPQMLSVPPEDCDVAFLNGDIERYVYPSQETIAKKQAELDKQHDEEMEKKWGKDWSRWLAWWKTWNDEIEAEFQSEGDREVQRKATNDEIKEHWEQWFVNNETDGRIIRNLKSAELITNEYFRYLVALKDGYADVKPPDSDDNTNNSDDDHTETEEAEPWLRWMNFNIKEGNDRPVYKGESGLWFSAKMLTSTAYVIQYRKGRDNLLQVFREGMKYFGVEENKHKTMAQFLCSMNLNTYVVNRSMCGQENTPTPEKLEPFVLTEEELKSVSDEDLPKISVVSPVFNDEDGFFLSMMSFELQDYPANKIEWVIVDDSTPGNDVQRMLPEKEDRIRYLRCSVKEGNRLTLGRKLNIGCKNASHDIIVVLTAGLYYPPTSLRARVVSLLKSPEQFEFVGCTRMGFYNVKTDTSFIVQQTDANDHLTIYHQDSIAFTKNFWTRRLFHEGLVEDFSQNIICIPFTMERYSLALDIPYENVAIKIDTVKRTIPDNEKQASFRNVFVSSFKEALIMLEREKVEYARGF